MARFENLSTSSSEFSNQSDDSSSSHKLSESPSDDEEFDIIHNIEKAPTPPREPLSPRFKFSFAYKTFKKRVPKILSDLAEVLSQNESLIMEQCGDYARFDLRRAIWSLNILRNDVLLNHDFKFFYDKFSDYAEWNNLISKLITREKNAWFSAEFLVAECYMYRRISIAFRRTETLTNFDYFSFYKKKSAYSSLHRMSDTLRNTRGLLRSLENLQMILKMSLWANRCDLSIHPNPSFDKIDNISVYDKHIIIDQSDEVWTLLTEGVQSSSYPLIIDIVLDNAGYELFVDLLLGEYLINSKLTDIVRYHVKSIPWFISDATENDFNWMLQFLVTQDDPELVTFGRKIRNLIRKRKIEICANRDFWTKPYGYSLMRELSPCLYVTLSFGQLVIFKGDLNYRKLIDDTNWNPTTPLKDCLGGFLPTSICALRSIKCDVYSGMPVCKVEWLTEASPNWMTTGKKGIIQVVIKPRP